MTKLAIIGASYLQEPLIRKAKERGIETHVFAWECGDVGEKIADHFYPISIIEKDAILDKCREIGIDGICSIASDLASITVNYVANNMGLIGNTMECTRNSTDKHLMRECFEKNDDPSPKSIKVESVNDLSGIDISFPVIVKPLDRSGSRGITKVKEASELSAAIENAKSQGFEKSALVEEFAEGDEYSVEYVSWKGKHTFLALTKKFTTGAPNFIETGHMEPADVSTEVLERVKSIVNHALDSLGIEYGASHSEVKIDDKGEIKIIEIGGRMGGDFIGSDLVEISTGFDFVNAVIDIALGNEPIKKNADTTIAAVRFIFSEEDVNVLNEMKRNDPDILVSEEVNEISRNAVHDSSERFGYYLFKSDNIEIIKKYLPEDEA